MGRPLIEYTEEAEAPKKGDECSWHSFARRLRLPSQDEASTSYNASSQTDVDAMLGDLLHDTWPGPARRPPQQGSTPLQGSPPQQHLTWSDALEQFPLLTREHVPPALPQHGSGLRLPRRAARRVTRDSDPGSESWVPPPLPRSSSHGLDVPYSPRGAATRSHMRVQFNDTWVARLANNSLTLPQSNTRSALEDARELLVSTLQSLDERLFEEDIRSQ